MPERCSCGNRHFDDIQKYYTHQQIEFPEIKLLVIHYELHKGECSCCGKTVSAKLTHSQRPGYGPRMSENGAISIHNSSCC